MLMGHLKSGSLVRSQSTFKDAVPCRSSRAVGLISADYAGKGMCSLN